MSDLSDPNRLGALYRSGLIRHSSSERLIRLCYTAVELLGCFATQVNAVTSAKQVYIAEWPRVAPRPESDVMLSGCKEVIAADDVIIIPDVAMHPVFCTLPWSKTWAAYLGVPLHYDGQTVGSLCALDVNKRAWSRTDVLTLRGVAGLVEQSLLYEV